MFLVKKKSGKRGSNPRPRPWQGRALPTELFPHKQAAKITLFFELSLTYQILLLFIGNKYCNPFVSGI